MLKETDSFVCIPFTKFSFSGKDAPAESFGLTNEETFLLELVREVVTTPDTSLQCDVVIDSALQEEIDTLVTAGDSSVIKGIVAGDSCSRDGLPICLNHCPLNMTIGRRVVPATLAQT